MGHDEPIKLDAIRIVTRCTTREQFVALFRRFCSPTACFVPSSDMRPAGLATAFSIRLADGTPLLRGHGVVLDTWKTGDNPFERPGVLLGIHHLTDDSTQLYEQLLVPETHAVRPIAQQLRMLHETVPVPTVHLETPTIEMPPLEVFPAPAIPVPVDSDPTVPTAMRDSIATLLGVAPLAPPKVYAAPALVPTEVVERVSAIPVEIDSRANTERVALDSWWNLPLAKLRHVPGWAVAATVAATLTTALLVVVT